MPNAALHFLLARQVLERWESSPIHAPFVSSAATRNAFLHGAVGPDMGYFPGADPLASHLAHHLRTGALCRALVREARTDPELAFAWGWVTHVLADVAVHPLVNDACGELLAGSRETPLWGDEVAAEHTAVEIGLDAAFHARSGAPRGDVLRPAFTPWGMRFVLRAYRRTYGASPRARALFRAHRRVALLSGPLALLRRVAARAVDARPGLLRRVARRAAAAPLAAISRALPAGSGARGLFAPVPPPAWLVAEVDEIVAGFADWFAGHHASGLVFLRDHCLDTGTAGAEEPVRARELLAGLHHRRPLPRPATGRAAA
jgi:hypothetical protein